MKIFVTIVLSLIFSIAIFYVLYQIFFKPLKNAKKDRLTVKLLVISI